MLGALAGWYYFVQGQIETAQEIDSARGTSAPNASPLGSTASNIGGQNSFPEQGAGGGQGPGVVAPSSPQPRSLLGRIWEALTGWTTSVRAPDGSNTLLFGTGGATILQGTTTETADTPKPAPRLWQAADTPVAGFGFLGQTSRLYYAERATGNMFQADPADSSRVRLTNTLFPKTYQAIFADDGAVILRSLKDSGAITTFAGTISTSSTADGLQTLEGLYLADNIISIAMRPTQDQIFYFSPGPDGVLGKTADRTGGNQKQVFSSVLRQWQSLYLADGSLYVMQNAADGVQGYAFRIVTGSAVPVVGPVAGLEILPRSASGALLYSSSGAGRVSLYARTSTSSTPVTLPIRTVAQKCVWAPGSSLTAYCAVPVSIESAAFLNELYSGALHTTDVWYRVDISTGTAEKVFATDSSLSLDVRDPDINDSGTHIAFRNAFDDTLWMFRIAQ